MAFELFKNAMRAIIEYHGNDKKKYPEIKALIVKGKEDLTIRISDFGGKLNLKALDDFISKFYCFYTII